MVSSVIPVLKIMCCPSYKWGHTYGARNFGLGPKSSNPCGSQNDVQEAMCQRIFESMPVLSIGILIAKCWFVWCATLYPLGNEGFILPTYIGCNWSSGLNWVRKQLNLILSSFIPHPVLHWLVILSPWVDFRCANGAQDSPVVEASWCWDSIYIYIYTYTCKVVIYNVIYMRHNRDNNKPQEYQW